MVFGHGCWPTWSSVIGPPSLVLGSWSLVPGCLALDQACLVPGPWCLALLAGRFEFAHLDPELDSKIDRLARRLENGQSASLSSRLRSFWGSFLDLGSVVLGSWCLAHLPWSTKYRMNSIPKAERDECKGNSPRRHEPRTDG